MFHIRLDPSTKRFIIIEILLFIISSIPQRKMRELSAGFIAPHYFLPIKKTGINSYSKIGLLYSANHLFDKATITLWWIRTPKARRLSNWKSLYINPNRFYHLFNFLNSFIWLQVNIIDWLCLNLQVVSHNKNLLGILASFMQ